MPFLRNGFGTWPDSHGTAKWRLWAINSSAGNRWPFPAFSSTWQPPNASGMESKLTIWYPNVQTCPWRQVRRPAFPCFFVQKGRQNEQQHQPMAEPNPTWAVAPICVPKWTISGKSSEWCLIWKGPKKSEKVQCHWNELLGFTFDLFTAQT